MKVRHRAEEIKYHQLRPHHEAWLTMHPLRSKQWLREKLVEGFDVHHIDGNHQNNDPANLVLIESHDHMRLHGNGRTPLTKLRGAWWLNADEVRDRSERAQSAYNLMVSSEVGSVTWSDAANRVGWTGSRASLCSAVAKLAADNGLRWPIWGKGEFMSARHRFSKIKQIC